MLRDDRTPNRVLLLDLSAQCYKGRAHLTVGRSNLVTRTSLDAQGRFPQRNLSVLERHPTLLLTRAADEE
jgi:hypothetical protein